MKTGMRTIRRIILGLFCLGATAALFGCQSGRMTTHMIELIDTKDGVKAKKVSVHTEEDVLERSPNVVAVTRYTDLAMDRWIGSYCLSPDNATLVLEIREQVTDARGSKRWISNLWAADADNPRGLQRLTDGIYFDRDPVWSPDSRFLYFASNRAGRSCIWRFSMLTLSGLEIVTSITTADASPQVSPDGAELLYTARTFPSSTPQLWSLALNGGLPTQLREGDWPRWSPDGKTVLFSALDHNTGKHKIWEMSPDSSSPVQLTNPENSNDIHPFYAPDQSQIVFASDRGQSSEGVFNYDLWITNRDGTGPRQLTTNGSRDDLPQFRKDGKALYFRSNRGGKWDLWKLSLEAGDVEAIANSPATE